MSQAVQCKKEREKSGGRGEGEREGEREGKREGGIDWKDRNKKSSLHTDDMDRLSKICKTIYKKTPRISVIFTRSQARSMYEKKTLLLYASTAPKIVSPK